MQELDLFANTSIPFPPPSVPAFTFIDLFAGIGGFRLALQSLGGVCVFSSEWHLPAANTYAMNFGDFPHGDITLQETKAAVPVGFDVLTGGFPCQPFSISGKMKGFEDTRGTLIYDVFEIVNKHQPKVVLLENVKHLKHHDSGRTLQVIEEGLQSLGYHVSWQILNASDFGVPQNRERIIIVATHKRAFDFSTMPKEAERPRLKDFLDSNTEVFDYLNEPYTLLAQTTIQKSGLIFCGYRNKGIRKVGIRPGTEHLSRVHKQPNRIYSAEGVHPALSSQETSGRFFIYDQGKVRKLTMSECFRIMGFPEEYIRIGAVSEQYRQIGNSVCVPMIKAVCTEIIKQGFI